MPTLRGHRTASPETGEAALWVTAHHAPAVPAGASGPFSRGADRQWWLCPRCAPADNRLPRGAHAPVGTRGEKQGKQALLGTRALGGGRGRLPVSPEPRLLRSPGPSSWPSAPCCVCCRLSLWHTSKACPTVRTMRIAWLWGRGDAGEGEGTPARTGGRGGACRGQETGHPRRPKRTLTERGGDTVPSRHPPDAVTTAVKQSMEGTERKPHLRLGPAAPQCGRSGQPPAAEAPAGCHPRAQWAHHTGGYPALSPVCRAWQVPWSPVQGPQ